MKITLGELRTLVEAQYRASAPKRWNYPEIDVEADNAQEAGEVAARKYGGGIDPFTISLVPTQKSAHLKPDELAEAIMDDASSCDDLLIDAPATRKVLKKIFPALEINVNFGENPANPNAPAPHNTITSYVVWNSFRNLVKVVQGFQCKNTTEDDVRDSLDDAESFLEDLGSAERIADYIIDALGLTTN